MTAPADRFTVPDEVLASQARREAALLAARSRPCAGDGGTCPDPGLHACSSYGGAWCDTHWAALERTTPTPDPARTAAALRERARRQDPRPCP